MQPSVLSPEFLRVLSELAKLVVLAMLIERALILIFDYRWYQKKLSGKGIKVPISYTVSLIICAAYKFDILSELFEPGKQSTMGIVLTAAILAGGSAGAITLFQGVLGFTKDAQAKAKEVRLTQAEASLAEAKARKELAEAHAASSIAEEKALQAEAEVRQKKAECNT